jgi:hypothetical protein
VNFLEDLEILLKEALKIPTDCVGCYRYCHINRWSSDSTYCHTGIDPKLISANITEDNQFFSKDKKMLKFIFGIVIFDVYIVMIMHYTTKII